MSELLNSKFDTLEKSDNDNITNILFIFKMNGIN